MAHPDAEPTRGNEEPTTYPASTLRNLLRETSPAQKGIWPTPHGGCLWGEGGGRPGRGVRELPRAMGVLPTLVGLGGGGGGGIRLCRSNLGLSLNVPCPPKRTVYKC